MSRIVVNFPFVFNSLGGVQPALDLDDNFNAIDLGTITISTRYTTGSQQLITDDDFSFFLCNPTNNINLTPPASMAANYSFWMSNQSTTKTVTLIGNCTVNGEAATNPVFPGTFGGIANVRGGLVVYDGSTLRMFSNLFVQ